MKSYVYKELVVEISDDSKSYKVWDISKVLKERALIAGGAGLTYNPSIVNGIIDKIIEDYIEDYESKANAAYGRYMYEECAEVGYDAKASREAHDEYLKYEEQVNYLKSLKA